MEDELRTLPEGLAVLRRRWKTWLLFLIIGVAAGVGISALKTPMYSATTSVLVQSPFAQNSFGRALDPEEGATQADVILSDNVAKKVIDDTGVDLTSDDLLKRVTAEPVQDKQVVTVTVTWPTAAEAAKVANSFATQFIQLGEDRAQQAQSTATNVYVQRVSETKAALAKLEQRLQTAPDAKKPEIQAEIDSLITRQAELKASLLTSDDASALIPRAEVLREAKTPTTAAQPNPLRAGILGGVIGLIFGLLLAFARERFDDVVREGDMAESVLGVPILGHVPRFSGNAVQGRVASLIEPQSAVAEATRVLNTNIRFLLAAHVGARPGAIRPGDLGGTVMVASGSPGEGKTSIATNLAVTAARGGARVIVVEADLRNPEVGKLFGVDAPRGLADLLIDGGSVTDYLLDVGVENLLLLPAGSIPPNPAELLASPQAVDVWHQLREIADLVVIDTPPILRVADAMEVAVAADALIMVARQGVTRTHQLQAAAKRLQRVGARISGLVINGDTRAHSNYAYGYGHQHPTTAKV